MLKYILIILFVCTPTFASPISYQPENIPHQSKEITELYTRLNYIMYEDLQLQHTYKVFDNIFILPNEFYGETEFYDLKFYLDMDTTISNDHDANNYRILYENRISTSTYAFVIPEPTMMLFFTIPFLITRFSKKEKALKVL